MILQKFTIYKPPDRQIIFIVRIFNQFKKLTMTTHTPLISFLSPLCCVHAPPPLSVAFACCPLLLPSPSHPPSLVTLAHRPLPSPAAIARRHQPMQSAAPIAHLPLPLLPPIVLVVALAGCPHLSPSLFPLPLTHHSCSQPSPSPVALAHRPPCRPRPSPSPLPLLVALA